MPSRNRFKNVKKRIKQAPCFSLFANPNKNWTELETKIFFCFLRARKTTALCCLFSIGSWISNCRRQVGSYLHKRDGEKATCSWRRLSDGELEWHGSFLRLLSISTCFRFELVHCKLLEINYNF